MTNVKIMSVFAIVAIAAIMGLASTTPAYAATKVLDEKFDNNITGPEFACGAVSFELNNKGHFVIWDNDKYSFKSITKSIMLDADGNIVGRTIGTISDIGTFGDAPQILQNHAMAICEKTGQILNLQFGYTLHKDGTMIFHGVTP